MSKKKLSLDAIANLKNSSSLTERVEKQKEIVKKDENKNIEYHMKNLRYPKEWHFLMKEAKNGGQTSLNEASYILEALRAKLKEDNIL